MAAIGVKGARTTGVPGTPAWELYGGDRTPYPFVVRVGGGGARETGDAAPTAQLVSTLLSLAVYYSFFLRLFNFLRRFLFLMFTVFASCGYQVVFLQ